jgi:hypothetical protein
MLTHRRCLVYYYHDPTSRNFGFMNPGDHVASRPKVLRAFRCMDISDTRRTASLAHRTSPVAMGSGGPSGLEDSPFQSSRARTGNARGIPVSRAFCAVLRRARPLETTDVTHAGTRAPGLLLSRIQTAMPHPAPQGREPSGYDRHYPKWDPGLHDTIITNPNQLGSTGRAKQGWRDTDESHEGLPVRCISHRFALFFSAEMNSFLSSLACFTIDNRLGFNAAAVLSEV